AAARAVLRCTLADRYGVCLDRLDPTRVPGLVDDLHGVGTDGLSASVMASALARADHDPQVARVLASIPDLLVEQATTAGSRPLRIWVVGAASGNGPTELAQLAHAASQLPYGARILGTDRDPLALQRISPPRLRRVEIWLSQADPMRDAVPGTFDLVICRGILTTLQPGRREALRSALTAAVGAGGALILDPALPPPRAARTHRRLHGQTMATPSATPPTVVHDRIRTALRFSETRRPDAALERLSQWAAADPTEPAYPTAAAEIALRQGNARRALSAARAAVALAPSRPTPHALLAEALLLAGRPAGQAFIDAEIRLGTRMPDAPLPLGMGTTAAGLRRRLDRARAMPALVAATA
ncbi:MAG: hypothetical protein VX265_12305, partial [Myxococcota bacterium]|nr:hypothetical protein [Myxococcota bacterium]